MEERWREPAALAEQYAGMLYRLAYARTGSRADAEDVMQEVFVRLLRARPEFRDEEHAKAWLLRVRAAPPMCSAPRGGGGRGRWTMGCPRRSRPGRAAWWRRCWPCPPSTGWRCTCTTMRS